MKLIQLLKVEAGRRGRMSPDQEIDAASAFELVRDMPYRRASDRRPETLIREWRGTCSGKHYLLKALYAEMGYDSYVMACLQAIRLPPNAIPDELRPALEAGGGKILDVHNYLVLELPEGEMIVDATWPLGAEKFGLAVNREFVLGQDQEIACKPLKCWRVPDTNTPQDFKQALLEENLTPEERRNRDIFIRAVGEWLGGG